MFLKSPSSAAQTSISLESQFYLTHVHEIMGKIPVHKEAVKSGIHVTYNSYLRAAEKIGKADLELLMEDDRYIRQVMLKTFGRNCFQFFYKAGGTGELNLNSIESIVLFYQYFKHTEKDPQKVEMAKAIANLLTYRSFKEELNTILSLTKGEYLDASKSRRTTNIFEWTRCNAVFRSYMRNVALYEHPEAMKYFYYVDVTDFSHVAYLMSAYNCDEQQAKSMLGDEGIFFKFLPLHVEAKLLEHILSNPLPNLRSRAVLTGEHKGKLMEYENANQETLATFKNAYTEIIHPAKINKLGQIMLEMSTELHARGLQDQIWLYHVNQSSFAITTNKPLEQLLPNTAHYATQITRFPADLEGSLI